MLVSTKLWAIAAGSEQIIFDYFRNTHAANLAITDGILAAVSADSGRGGARFAKSGPLARLPVRGILTKNYTLLSALTGGTPYSHIGQGLAAAVADQDVESIVLDIDSPGGAVDGLPELGEAIRAARKSKPVTAEVNGAAMSAAYYIAANADKIYASHALDQVGSIGVKMVEYDYSKEFEAKGVRPVVIDSGVHKSAGEPGTVITDEQAAVWREAVDKWMDHFVATVATGRNLPESAVRAAGDGRMIFADDAARLGLIDGVQSRQGQQPQRAGRRTDTAKARQRLRGLR